MAWCKTNVSDFFRWKFFFFKSARIIACAFKFRSKTFPCIIFWAALHFVSEKNKDKILWCAQWMQQGRTRENHFFKFSAPLIIRVDVGQVIKARVYLGYFFLEYRFKSWNVWKRINYYLGETCNFVWNALTVTSDRSWIRSKHVPISVAYCRQLPLPPCPRLSERL